MNGWGGGYVTDVPYTAGWYRNQAPARIALAGLLGGACLPIPTGDDPVHLLELGCGYGYTAMALAASNPSWSVTAVDFNPLHIASARAWAADAGLTNITFIEADLARWEDHPVLRAIPEMDYVTMHGVWTWVPKPVRDGIVRLLAQKVTAGGAVQLSYNSVPGWTDMLAAARLVRAVGNRTTGHSGQGAQAGFAMLKDLIAAKARLFESRPGVAETVTMMEGLSPAYLAHEFMNEAWAPTHMIDVAEALADAKLDFVGESDLSDNFPRLILTEPQQALVAGQPDPLLRQMMREMCAPRPIRQDVYVRGARTGTEVERMEALLDLTVALTAPPASLVTQAVTASGTVRLDLSFLRPAMERLRQGPAKVAELAALPGVAGAGVSVGELVACLSAANMIEPTARPGTEPSPTAMRFNRTAVRRLHRTERPDRMLGAACGPTGMPVRLTMLELTILNFVSQGATNVAGLMALMGVKPENQADARAQLTAFMEETAPVLRAAGVY